MPSPTDRPDPRAGEGGESVPDAAEALLSLMGAGDMTALGLSRPDEPRWVEAGRLLFSGPCHFVCGAPHLEALPSQGPPEIAFAGRSNVGKSSLINALTGRKTLARTSNTPGRTQELNFFSVQEGQMALVDLPGYGFAQAPKVMVRSWTRTLKAYLAGRSTLRRVMLLIDSRHGPKAGDFEMMDMLDDAAVVYQVVLTKVDKPKTKELTALYKDLGRTLAKRRAIFPRVIKTSSVKGKGIAALRAEIALLGAS